MIYAAEIISTGIINPDAFIVQPKYTRIDGVDALTIEALPINGLYPGVGDIVFCAEGINDFNQEIELLINDNGGAFPLIFATLVSPIVYKIDMQLLGKMTLGEGSSKMVLGEALAAWAQSVDTALSIIQGAAGSDYVPTITASEWQDNILSENHKLD
ncbi:MAG: hypothetical protein JXN64_06275 [Spirochaetes bacterium]|nr:hypothetical protein [Spirochaetota bacterium]